MAVRMPDLNLGAALLHLPRSEPQVKIETAAALPLFDRNQGNIVAARADLERSQNEVRQVELRLTDRLSAVFPALPRRPPAGGRHIRRASCLTPWSSLRLGAQGDMKARTPVSITPPCVGAKTLAQARLAYVQAPAEFCGDPWSIFPDCCRRSDRCS